MSVSSSMEIITDFASVPIEIPEESSMAEAIRRSHIRAEGDVKTAGTIILIFAVLGAFNYLRSAEPMSATPVDLCMLVAFGISGVLLRGLHASGRWMYSILIVIDLVMFVLAFPQLLNQIAQGDTLSGPPSPQMQNIIHWMPKFFMVSKSALVSFFLFILWRRNARIVTSKQYRNAVIPATPYMESSRSTWIIVVTFGLPVLFVFVAILLAAMAV